MRPTPAAALLEAPGGRLACLWWLVEQGLYQLPTLELVEFVRTLIGGRSALEICAGQGWLGAALGIPSTDGWVFEHPAIAARTALAGQVMGAPAPPPCPPAPHVKRLEASAAVAVYRPSVVVGCWVTHRFDTRSRTGSTLGVDDLAILAQPSVQRLILVGNVCQHGPRPALRRKHSTHAAPWLFDRGHMTDPNGSRVWWWDR